MVTWKNSFDSVSDHVLYINKRKLTALNIVHSLDISTECKDMKKIELKVPYAQDRQQQRGLRRRRSRSRRRGRRNWYLW